MRVHGNGLEAVQKLTETGHFKAVLVAKTFSVIGHQLWLGSVIPVGGAVTMIRQALFH